jgi:hypothetical protein
MMRDSPELSRETRHCRGTKIACGAGLAPSIKPER